MFYYIPYGSLIQFHLLPENTSHKNRIFGTIDGMTAGSVKKVIAIERDTTLLIGSCIVNTDGSWEIHAEYTNDGNIVCVLIDEDGETDSKSHDKLSMCDITYSSGMLENNLLCYDPKYKAKADIVFDSMPYTGTVTVEDLRGDITGFKFDNIGWAGRFTDASNTEVSYRSKVKPGTIVNIDGDTARISSMANSGTTSGDVKIDRLIKNGHAFTTQILGDSSCIFFSPLVRDLKGYGYDYTKVYTKLQSWGDGKDIYSKSIGVLTTTTIYNGGIVYQDVILTGQNYTVSFWFYNLSLYNDPFVCQEGFLEIISYTGSYIYVRLNTTGGTATNITISLYNSFTTSTWNHVIVSVGTTGCTIWVNGIQKYTNSTAYSLTAVSGNVYVGNCVTINGFISMGGDSISSTWNRNNKRMCMVRIFNKRVSTAEAAVLYAETFSSGGIGSVNYLTNLFNTNGHINMVGTTVSGNTAIMTPDKTLPPIAPTNISVDHVYGGGKRRVLYKGSVNRRYQLDMSNCYWNYVTNVSSDCGFCDDNLYNQYSSYILGDTLTSAGIKARNDYFQLDLPYVTNLTGMRYRTYSYTNNYDYPSSLELYSSDTGVFCGEERYNGTITISGGTTYNTLTEWANVDSIANGRSFRFYATDKSSIYNATGHVGFRNVIFEIEADTHPETIKARSIIVDIASNWGNASYTSVVKLYATLNGEPISTKGWLFYQTSYSTATTYVPGFDASAAMDPINSNRLNSVSYVNCFKTSGTGSIRLIAVAPEIVEFDDIYFVNYAENQYTNANYGAKNTKIKVSTDVITNTTYNATVSNSATIYSGQLPEMFTSSTYAQYLYDYEYMHDTGKGGYLSMGSKPVSARAIAIDFSKNHGDATYIGIKKVEFYYKGIRVVTSITSCTASTYYGSTTYITNTFSNAYYQYGAYTSYPTWRSSSGNVTNQRITVLFSSAIKFDAIRIWNYYDYNATDFGVNIGVADATIYGSMYAGQPTSTYGSTWTDSYEIMQKSDIRKRNKLSTSTWSLEYFNRTLGYRKTDKWSARSVVFDISSNHYDNVRSGIGFKHIIFNIDGNPISYSSSWGVYDSAHDTGYESVNGFTQYANMLGVAASGESWYYSGSAPVRIVVVFDSVKYFDDISIQNWVTANTGDRFYGIKTTKITITQDTLTSSDAVYDATVSNGLVIFNNDVPMVWRADMYANNSGNRWKSIVSKSSVFYSRTLELLIQSNTTNGSTTFTDSGYRNLSIETGGSPVHTTSSYIIGTSSIDVSNGYLSIPKLRARDFESVFKIGMWIYPTSTTGDKGLFSRWGASGSYSYMLSINGGYLEFKYSTDGTTIVTCTGSSVINSNTWTWVEVRRAGDSIYLFVGSSLVGTFTVDFSYFYDANAQLLIGSYNSSISNCFQGYLQEITLRTGGYQDNVGTAGPTSFKTITPTLTTTLSGISTSLSFDQDSETYSVYNGGWRPIASKDPDIHGVAGDTSWYYRDNSSTWTTSTGIYSAHTAISKATEYSNNRMSKSTLGSLTQSNYGQTGGYQDYTPSIASTFYRENYNTSLILRDTVINNKKYWYSGAMNIKNTPITISGTNIDWTVTSKTPYLKDVSKYMSSLSVYNLVDTDWVQCSRGGSIPALINGTTLSGGNNNLYFKAEFDLSTCNYYRRNIYPTLMFEIY